MLDNLPTKFGTLHTSDLPASLSLAAAGSGDYMLFAIEGITCV